MVKNGLYRVSFQTPLGAGAGVLHLMDGRLWGGDTGLYYVGTYTINENELIADVTTNRHTQIPGNTSVFGIDHVHIQLRGPVQEDHIAMTGSAAEAPGISFQVILNRIAD